MADGGARGRVQEVCVLLLEDSDIDAELLSAHLEKTELKFNLHRTTNRREFVHGLEEHPCDIILADYSLPDFDGLSALNIARALRPDIPFIFVSGVVGEEFATNALKRGATDYVLKRNLTRLGTAVERALEQAREREERLRAEQQLDRVQMRAALAMEGAGLGAWDLDPRDSRLEWDERSRALFQVAADSDSEIDYRAFLKMVHPDDRRRLDRAISRATTWRDDEDGFLFEEFRTQPSAGPEQWLALRAQAQFVDQVCTRFAGVLRDVTEERRTKRELESLAQNLEQQVAERTAERDRIWRLSRDLFVAASTDGRLRRVNPAWQALLGYDPAALVGSDFHLLVHPDDAQEAGKSVKMLAAGLAPPRFENRLRHADGSWRWVSWTAAPEGDAFYAVGRDITEEKAAGVALAERNAELAAQISERERVEKELRQMQRLEAVGQLTSGVAHDFNNLLTVILGNVRFIERAIARGSLNGELAERIGYMRTAAERGAKLTGQMLAFSRRQKLEPKTVDLNETVGSMRELLHSTMGGTVRLETVLKPDLWSALVDPTQIELIILNLAINARDAMEVGGSLTVETANVTIDAEPARAEEPGPGEYVVLAVSDTGHGMSEEVLAKAFEPFFTTKGVGRGSGLGLAQVYGFAKQSGGGVSIRTRPGEGTTVSVYLPRASVKPVKPPVETTPEAPPAPSGVTILLVDDDSAVREVTASLLREFGYQVTEAGSGNAALDILRGGKTAVDLLLADYAMPGMNGVETVKAAQAMRPGLPALFITGFADLAALREVGEDRIIQKPFREEELARKVAAMIGASAAQGGKVIPLRR